MKRASPLIACMLLCGCASSISNTALPEADREVVAALIAHEIVAFASPRPVLILTPTETWLPAERHEERPPDIPPDIWAQLQLELPAGLRSANERAYSLAGVALPANAVLYDRGKFERQWRSASKFASLVATLGGKEPLVLSVSRPFVQPGEESAVVLLHVLSTWSGCGGVNRFSVTRTAGTWGVQLQQVLSVW